jgi:protein O-mannosyl-transferase
MVERVAGRSDTFLLVSDRHAANHPACLNQSPPTDDPTVASGKSDGTSRRDIFAIAALLLAMAWFTYQPVRQFEFTNYDDQIYVSENPRVHQGLTWGNVGWAFTTGHTRNWHPLTWLSHMLDWQMFGADAGAHHSTNAAIHALNTVLLFLVMTSLTGAVWRSAAVAALFALHPMNVESVAWVAERKNVLSTTFWLLATWAYVRYTRRPGAARYLVVLMLLTLGLTAKAMLVTLPFVFLLLDYWPLQRTPWHCAADPASKSVVTTVSFGRLVLEKVPMFTLSLASAIVTAIVAEGAVAAAEKLPFIVRLETAAVAYPLYLGKLIWPEDLAVLYPHPGSWPLWQVMGSVALIGFMSLVAAAFARSRPYLMVGWLWFIGTLVPVLGLVQVSAHSIADRYAYVSFIGLFIMIVWMTTDLAGHFIPERKPRVIALSAVAALILGTFYLATRAQLSHWRNSITLFSHAVAVTTRNPIAQYNLGQALSDRRELGPAIAHYEEAIRLKPNYAPAHSNLGLCLLQTGRLSEATNQYIRALELQPDDETANLNYGIALQLMGRPAEAIGPLDKALRQRPDDDLAHTAMGRTLLALGRTSDAGEHFSKAIQLAPGSLEPRFLLGMVLIQNSRPAEAEAQFRELTRLQPSLASAQLELANALDAQGKSVEAIGRYREALRLDPNLVEALNNLAWLLATHPQSEIRNGAEAVTLAERACELGADKVPVLIGTLAAAYAEAGRFDDAAKVARKAHDLAASLGDMKLAEQNQKLEELFKSGKAFRQAR